MKKLISILVLIPFLAQAAGPEIKEASDVEIRNRLVSIVKDIDVEKKLSEAGEFKECRDKNEFDPKNPNNKKLADATKCFKDKLDKKDPESLKKLADTLELENYGLIKSKTVQDITEYLSNKMIKSLTGRDPNEKDPKKIREQLKFENQKFVDQSVFLELYVTQLGKSALYEVSRYCFENLRLNTGSGSNFQEHWKDYQTVNVQKVEAFVNDLGKKDDFFSSGIKGFSDQDLAASEKVFNEMIQGITQTDIDPKLMQGVFYICQASIKPLCEDFKNKQVKSTNQDDSVVSKSTSAQSKGSNACLTMSRLQSVRTAMANAKKVLEEMRKLGEKDKSIAIELVLSNPIKLYERGKGRGEETVDEITSMSSTDILSNQDAQYLKRIDECSKDGSKNDCKDDLGSKEELDKALHNAEMESNFKRELELARVKKLYEDNKKLQEYLEAGGYFELVEKMKNNQLPTQSEIENAIKSNFDSKKMATIQSLHNKVGSRQLSENANDQQRESTAQTIASEAKEERARLAQVVLFNNIITSHLELKDQDGNVLGKNVSAWVKENKDQESNSKYNTKWFQGLQADAKNQDLSKTRDASIIDVGIIDSILGKKDSTSATTSGGSN